MKRRIFLIYAVLFAIGIPYMLWLLLTGAGIPCLYYTLTGFLCPGCGISRMFLALLRLDLAAAFFYNPAVFLLLIYWNVIAVSCLLERLEFLRKKAFLFWSLGVSVAMLVIFGILRNIS